MPFVADGNGIDWDDLSTLPPPAHYEYYTPDDFFGRVSPLRFVDSDGKLLPLESIRPIDSPLTPAEAEFVEATTRTLRAIGVLRIRCDYHGGFGALIATTTAVELPDGRVGVADFAPRPEVLTALAPVLEARRQALIDRDIASVRIGGLSDPKAPTFAMVDADTRARLEPELRARITTWYDKRIDGLAQGAEKRASADVPAAARPTLATLYIELPTVWAAMLLGRIGAGPNQIYGAFTVDLVDGTLADERDVPLPADMAPREPSHAVPSRVNVTSGGDMVTSIEIAPELERRVASIAVRSRRTPAEVIADALEHGHSLEWQEYYLNKVEAGIAAADRGDFASPGDVERAVSKYRPS